MADIKGIEGLTPDALAQQIQRGGRFVVYQYVISVLIMTFQRGSAVYYLPPGTNPVVKGLPYTLFTLVVGWWGIPWGIYYTIRTLITNLRGGRDVTAEGRPPRPLRRGRTFSWPALTMPSGRQR